MGTEKRRLSKARYREKNKEKIKLYNKKYYLDNIDKVKEIRIKWEKENPEKLIEIRKVCNRNWYSKNKHKAGAHSKLRWAIKTGRVEKQLCFICGEEAEAHHPCYALPLAVSWLCTKHHKETHRMLV